MENCEFPKISCGAKGEIQGMHPEAPKIASAARNN